MRPRSPAARLSLVLAAVALPPFTARAQSAPPSPAPADTTRQLLAAAGTTAATTVPATIPGAAVASEEPFTADRPGFTFGPMLLPRGHQQVETGYSYARAGSERDHAVGEVLLRAGLASAVEMRLALNSYEFASTPDGRTSGLDDAFVATKLRLLNAGEGLSLRPQTALIVGTSLPVGSRAFGRHRSEPDALLTAAWATPLATALTVNLGAASRDAGGGTRVGEYRYGASFAFPIAAHVGSYLEYTSARTGAHGPDQRYLNTGIAVVPGHVAQIDAWTAVGLHRGAPDYRMGLGLVRRW